METPANWIYYLKLQKELTPEFLILDQKFKEKNKSLVPISIGNINEMIRSKQSIHLLIVIRTLGEYTYFNRKIKKLMKVMIRTGRINLYIVSSFTGVNDNAIMRRDYYNFIKLPVAYDFLTESISDMVDIKEYGIQKWPGGIRSSFSLAS